MDRREGWSRAAVFQNASREASKDGAAALRQPIRGRRGSDFVADLHRLNLPLKSPSNLPLNFPSNLKRIIRTGHEVRKPHWDGA